MGIGKNIANCSKNLHFLLSCTRCADTPPWSVVPPFFYVQYSVSHLLLD